MRVILLVLFVLFYALSNAQTPRLSFAEFTWSVFHPFAAIKVKNLTSAGNRLLPELQIDKKLDSFTAGGKADAFRHVYFMALYAQKIKPKKLVKLGKAHERSNYRSFRTNQDEYGEKPDSLSSVMDLNNNHVGIQLGSDHKSFDKNELATLVINEILQGKALIFKRNKKGEYLTCEGKLINMKEFEHTWSVPKCLVPSNQQPE